MRSVPLSPKTRDAALETMRSGTLDVLVVGGGVVGGGAALDAATRGLSVGLVEARDFASGTSSRSSKLMHGGLRYLEMLDFGLVAEALKERGLNLRRLAPHLVQDGNRGSPDVHRIGRAPQRPRAAGTRERRQVVQGRERDVAVAGLLESGGRGLPQERLQLDLLRPDD